jgi:hypothetical protein
VAAEPGGGGVKSSYGQGVRATERRLQMALTTIRVPRSYSQGLPDCNSIYNAWVCNASMPRAVIIAFSSSSSLDVDIPLHLLGLLKGPPDQLPQPPQNTLTARLLISQ